jgi:hypothetical protein
VAFTFSFPWVTDAQPDGLQAWLVGQGEPFELEGHELRLRALPVQLTANGDALLATVDLSAQVRLPRLVGLLFELALWLGTDLQLDGRPIDRATAWLRLADDQDRMRIAQAIDRAGPRTDEVLAGLWLVLRALGRHHDLRWDPRSRAIVEIRTQLVDADDETTVSRRAGAPGVVDLSRPGHARPAPHPMSPPAPHPASRSAPHRALSAAPPSFPSPTIPGTALGELHELSADDLTLTAEASEETGPLAVLSLPVHDGIHVFAWRWLAETWPALTD